MGTEDGSINEAAIAFFKTLLAFEVVALLLQCLRSKDRGEIFPVGGLGYQFWNVTQIVLVILVVFTLSHINNPSFCQKVEIASTQMGIEMKTRGHNTCSSLSLLNGLPITV